MKIPKKYENVILNDKAEVLLPDIPEESIDLLATDPPYGINFMGTDWDKAIAPADIWEHCYRVLKPGAFIFVMCIPRQDCLAMAISRLAHAGFDVNFTSIYWTYATGLPKAMDVAKLIDKKFGGEFVDVTAPATEEALAMEGAYASFLPKPAVEIVLVGMKPITEKSYTDQALKNGKAVTWLDDCRIPFDKNSPPNSRKAQDFDFTYTSKEQGGGGLEEIDYEADERGRFAPNLLVSDNVLDSGKIVRSSGGKAGNSSAYSGGFNEEFYKGFRSGKDMSKPGYGDEGDYSRYFSLDAWAEKHLPASAAENFPFLAIPKPSSAEKNAGLEGMPKKNMYKGDNSFSSLELIGTTDGGRLPRENYHPTVKPIKLMSYLIMLGSREGDVVLDPFVGSGTTAIAAALLDRIYIGMEEREDFCEIAKQRIAHHTSQLTLDLGG